MNNSHHYGWMAVVLIVFGVTTYIFTLNRPDEYNKGSIHAEQHRQDWPLSFHIGEGGCARMDSLKSMEGVNANTISKTTYK